MQAVHILVRINRGDDSEFIQMARQRQLAQYAIDRRIGVQRLHQRDEISLTGVRGQAMFETRHADFHRLPPLVRDIDAAGGIIPHQHDGKARRTASLACKGRDAGGNAATQGLRKGFAVNQPCIAHAIVLARLRK